jgi:predicted metal-dependent enzyme (double-stranded beta helix superfamily)
MFDLDAFLDECVSARDEADPQLALKEVLARAVADPEGVAGVLPPERAEIARLHVSPELTVIKVVWAPGMQIPPHDHRVWAAIGIYTGGEDNAFFRRVEGGIEASGGKELRVGDVCLLGHDAVHAVTNPTSQFAGAIHAYGGDFFTLPRSEWDPDTREEHPHDMASTLRYFEEANREYAEQHAADQNRS